MWVTARAVTFSRRGQLIPSQPLACVMCLGPFQVLDISILPAGARDVNRDKNDKADDSKVPVPAKSLHGIVGTSGIHEALAGLQIQFLLGQREFCLIYSV